MVLKTTLKYNFPQKVNKHTHTHTHTNTHTHKHIHTHKHTHKHTHTYTHTYYIGNVVRKCVISHSIGRNANRTIRHCKIP